MDFTAFDKSAQAETGKAFDILHPFTLKPIVKDGKVSRFIIRAPSAKTVRAVPAGTSDFKVMGDYQAKGNKTGAAYIAGFENVERDGKPCTEADAEWFLGLTSPVYEVKGGALGKQLNKTFLDQVNENAAAFGAELGNVDGG
jgi:hypothetical protein